MWYLVPNSLSPLPPKSKQNTNKTAATRNMTHSLCNSKTHFELLLLGDEFKLILRLIETIFTHVNANWRENNLGLKFTLQIIVFQERMLKC